MTRDRITAANACGLALGIGFGAVFGAALGGIHDLTLGDFNGVIIALLAGGGAIMGGVGAALGTWLLRGIASSTTKGKSTQSEINAPKLAALVATLLVQAGTTGLVLAGGVISGTEPYTNVVQGVSLSVGGLLAILKARP